MEFDISKTVQEIVMQAKETQEDFIIETIYPYCEDILQMKINKEELKRILIKGMQKSQPCVDCVSRKKILGRIDAERRHLLDVGMDGAEHILVHHARRIIEDMPSVEPTRPEGKWIPLEGDLKKCPVCGEHSLCPSKFCCSCGAELEINSVSIFGCAED